MTTMDDLFAAQDRAARYGVREDGAPVGSEYHSSVNRDITYSLANLKAAGGRISRLRLLTERGYPYFDVSYVHGVLPDGTVVPVLPPDNYLRRGSLKRDLITWAKSEGVYAIGIGLLDEGNHSILWG